MRYFRVISSPKSHWDGPSPVYTDFVAAESEDSPEIQQLIKGCEDYDIQEISKQTYNSFTHGI